MKKEEAQTGWRGEDKGAIMKGTHFLNLVIWFITGCQGSVAKDSKRRWPGVVGETVNLRHEQRET